MFLLVTAILISFILSLTIAGMALLLSQKKTKDLEKSTPFESGLMTFEPSHRFFSIHFFMVALIFLIFDTELIVLFPILFKVKFLLARIMSISLILVLLILIIGVCLEWAQIMFYWAE